MKDVHEEPNYNKEEVAEWKKVRDKLKELDITVKNVNKCFNEATVALERLNKDLYLIKGNSEEEYCD